MEAGPGGQQDITREPPGHLPRRTASDRCPVLHTTMAQVALRSPDDRHQALRDTMTELLSMDEPRRRIAAMLSGLDINDLGEGHPLLGRRCPTSTCIPRTVPRAYSPCCTTPGPCSSTSVNPAVSTFLLGRIESGWSTPGTMACGSSPSRRDRCAPGRVDPTRRARRLGRDLTDPELPQALGTWFGSGHSGLEPDSRAPSRSLPMCRSGTPALLPDLWRCCRSGLREDPRRHTPVIRLRPCEVMQRVREGVRTFQWAFALPGM